MEIFVIDNASGDSTLTMLKSFANNAEKINILPNKQNIGFAKANNIGIRKCRGKYILILNPDTEILPATLETMYNFMENNLPCGLAGCKHLNPDLTIQPSIRKFPDLFSQILILLKIHRIWPNLKILKKYFASDFDYSKTQTVDQLAGSCILCRRGLIDRIGMFDEKFYIWFEDVDLCYRSQMAEFLNYYLANAAIIHHGGQSFRQMLSLEKQKKFNSSLRYYFKKNNFYFSWLTITLVNPLSLFLSWLNQNFKNIARKQ